MIGAVLRLTDNSEAIAGANVEAMAGGVACGQAVTDASGAFEIVTSSNGAAGICGSAGDNLTFRVNGDVPVRTDMLPHGNTTMVLLFIQ
jgi:hypothetical protein